MRRHSSRRGSLAPYIWARAQAERHRRQDQIAGGNGRHPYKDFMLKSRFVVGISLIGTMVVLGTGLVSGQTFPSKPIRIVTLTVGGNADFSSRLIAERISVPLAQPVIVENRETNIAAEVVAKATAD